jgi:hypothetical protein
MPGRLIALFVLASASCPARPPAPASPQPPAAAEPEYVLVRDSAWLYPRPDWSAKAVRLADPFSRPQGVQVWAARRLGEEGEFVAIETIPAATARCYPGPVAFAPYRLRLWVGAADVSQVTTRPVIRRFADGTAVELAAGVAVAPEVGEPGRYQADVAGLRVAATLPAGSVGDRYRPRSLPPDPPGAPGDDGAASPVVTGATGAALPAARTGAEARLLREGTAVSIGDEVQPPLRAPLAVSWARAVDREVIVGVHGPCLHAVVRAPAASLTTAGDVAPVAPARAEPGQRVAAGVTVFWPDGTEAGVTVDPVVLDDTPRPAGDLPCFTVPISLGGGSPQTMVLCFRADDLEQ